MDDSSATQEGISATGGDGSSADDEDVFMVEVNHHGEKWWPAHQFILSLSGKSDTKTEISARNTPPQRMRIPVRIEANFPPTTTDYN